MIRVATLSKTFEHVSRTDEALDLPENDADLIYEQWMDGKADLPLKPGEKPTIFRFERPSPKVHAMVLDAEQQGGYMGAIVTAVELTLREAKNLLDEGGNEITLKTRTDNHGVTRLTKESLDIFSSAPSLLYELGTRVVTELRVKKK